MARWLCLDWFESNSAWFFSLSFASLVRRLYKSSKRKKTQYVLEISQFKYPHRCRAIQFIQFKGKHTRTHTRALMKYSHHYIIIIIAKYCLYTTGVLPLSHSLIKSSQLWTNSRLLLWRHREQKNGNRSLYMGANFKVTFLFFF